MDRIIKINLFVFVVLITLTALVNLIKENSGINFGIFLLAFVFDVSLFFIVTILSERISSNKSYISLVIYLIFSLFFVWYIISTITYLFFGSYLTLGGVYFIIATRSLFAKVFIISFAILFVSLLAISMYSLEKNKTMKNPKLYYVLVPLVIIILVVILFPKGYISSSPPINFILKLFNRPQINNIDIENPKLPIDQKILDISLNATQPNIVLIMLESLSAEHTGYYGYKRNITPNIDNIAKNSIVFKEAYSIATHSDYSQTAFLSSRHTITNSQRTFFSSIDYPRTFIWDVLYNKGYSTAYISSQDDEWADIKSYFNLTNLDRYSYSLSDNKSDYGSGKAAKDFDEETLKKAIDYINSSNSPFFIYVNFQATHFPYSYPEGNSYFLPQEPVPLFLYIPKDNREAMINRYDNALYYVDKQIGELFDFLVKRNIINNTIVIITSDHGENFNLTYGSLTHGENIRYPEVHVPLIIYLPDKQHRIVSDRVSNIDLIPTIIDILGFEISPDFQGIPMTKNKPIIFYNQNLNFNIGAIIGDIKYMLDMKKNVALAYNLSTDPYELDNLIKNESDKEEYHNRYGRTILSWYKCQLDYYSNKRYLDAQSIKCAL